MIKIRYANAADAEILAILHVNSWKEAYKGIIPDDYLNRMTIEKRQSYFSKVLSEESEKDALVFVDDKPAGFICLGKCRDEDNDGTVGEIWGIYLLPEFWRKGVGTILLNWGINELTLLGFTRITLWVLKDNLTARYFYEKNGFILDGNEKPITLGINLIECRYSTKKDSAYGNSLG
jgi:GNAT superfamily N-acetyltransferase